MCEAVAPPVTTDFTLIGPPHSWRVVRVATAEGTNTLEWRCSACWSKRAGSS